jgi:hypothetical protein
VTEKPWRFRRKKSTSKDESERRDTNRTGSEAEPSEADPNIDRFWWGPGDVRIVYDPYEEKRKKRKQGET